MTETRVKKIIEASPRLKRDRLEGRATAYLMDYFHDSDNRFTWHRVAQRLDDTSLEHLMLASTANTMNSYHQTMLSLSKPAETLLDSGFGDLVPSLLRVEADLASRLDYYPYGGLLMKAAAGLFPLFRDHGQEDLRDKWMDAVSDFLSRTNEHLSAEAVLNSSTATIPLLFAEGVHAILPQWLGTGQKIIDMDYQYASNTALSFFRHSP